MIKTLKRLKRCRIRTKLSILIVISAFISIFLFRSLWLARWDVWELCIKCFPQLTCDRAELMDTLRAEAINYELPESEDDTEAVKALEPFFALTDDYTGIYLYGFPDGLYRAGKMPTIMADPVFRMFFESGYAATAGDGEDYIEVCWEFKNGLANAILFYYHRSRISYPWFVISILLSIGVFLGIILLFINRKMKHVVSLEEEILLMASGDLSHPIPACGEDEIGILSRELDQLRLSLSENIRREQESRQANQDLIAALSHDLRTPLTILNGYLEVLKLKRNPAMQEEYLDRCLQKTEDIKEMTDRMFEYALVPEENETPALARTSADFARQYLQENSDYIRLAGFHVRLALSDSDAVFLSDETMLKRIFNNLFSNILKYGDKKDPVLVTESILDNTLNITITNTIKQEHSEAESNHIGLKSTEKMMALIGGEIQVQEEKNLFTVHLLFRLL